MTPVAAIEMALLVAFSWPALRLVLDRELRQCAPRPMAVIAFGLSILAALAIAVAVMHPAWLHWITGFVAAGSGIVAWRARSGFGRGRSLPPGSLSLTRSITAIGDRRFYAKECERHGPVFKMAQFYRGTICVVGLERGHRILTEHRDALGPGSLPFSRDIPGGFLRYMAPRTYESYGPLFRSALSRRVVQRGEETTVQVVREELARMVEDCASAGSGFVEPGVYLERIAFVAFVRVLFGFAPGTDVFREFESGYRTLQKQSLSRSFSAETRVAMESLRGLVGREARRLATRDGAPGSALEALVASDPSMPDQTCIDNLLFIIKISSSNVVGLATWMLTMLGRHPQWLRRLRDEVEEGPAEESRKRLADRIVTETLRLEQSEYLYRSIQADFLDDGLLFPRGWLLRLCVKESHRDADIFESPAEFDPDRFLGRRFATTEYAPFGKDQHECNGVSLANMICRCFVEELARGYDAQITGDQPLERDFRHWSHWRPNSQLALQLTPLRAAVVV